MTMTFPWQKPPFTANTRFGHWRQERAMKKDCRDISQWVANGLPKGCTFVVAQLEYKPKDNRRRDPMNLTPLSKALIDGLVRYGLVPDDNPQYLREEVPIISPAVSDRMVGRIFLHLDISQ